MGTHEISSPRAAELYFNTSLVGHVASLLAEAFSGARTRRGSAGRAAPRAGRPVSRVVARRGWLERLDAWFWRQEQKRREAYLAQAADVFELERRIDALDRADFFRYY